MQLPDELQQAIEQAASTVDRAALTRGARDFSERYQAGNFHTPPLATSAHRVAYLYARMPATYAANWHVFAELRRMLPEVAVESMLDLGAGPGTSMWAAAEFFPTLRNITLVERDAGLAELGRELAGQSSHEVIRSAKWSAADVTNNLALDHADLVIVSYLLGELPAAQRERVVRLAWNLSRKLLVVIEPGTPHNFQSVLLTRDMLISSANEGAQVIAPCPHENACPMAEAGEWCHFAQRLERTAEHRKLKGGELGYEDEKFSYVIGSRMHAGRPQSRIVRHPRFHPGHVVLTLCTPDGLRQQTIGKSQKAAYRAARKASWGKPWPDSTTGMS